MTHDFQLGFFGFVRSTEFPCSLSLNTGDDNDGLMKAFHSSRWLKHFFFFFVDIRWTVEIHGGGRLLGTSQTSTWDSREGCQHYCIDYCHD